MAKTSGLVIPDYNEGERVLEVISTAKNCPELTEITVVNDGSIDNTHEILNRIDGVSVVTHRYNQGKGEALDTGVRHLRGLGCEQIVFLDGDLRGIEPRHINDLLSPLEQGALMTIGYLGLRKAVVKKAILQQWGALSGQRAIQAHVWDMLNSRDKHGFNIEAAFNARLRKQKLHRDIARVSLDGVGHVGKKNKEGSLRKAIWGYTKTYSAAFYTYARIEVGG